MWLSMLGTLHRSQIALELPAHDELRYEWHSEILSRKTFRLLALLVYYDRQA